MTNLIAQLTISLVLATNWVGVNNSTNELGYVVTNHVATIQYEGETHAFTLKSQAGNIAAWRPQAPVTNCIIYWTNLSVTNFWNPMPLPILQTNNIQLKEIGPIPQEILDLLPKGSNAATP